MRDPKDYVIHKDLDAPIPFFAWEVVDVVVAILLMGLCTIMQQFILGVVLLVVVLKIAKKMRSGAKQGQVQHLLWRIGLTLDKPLKENGPNPVILEYFE